MKPDAKRLLIVLYAGDYRAAYYRFANGQSETYHAHNYAIQSLIDMGQKIAEVAVLCCYSQAPYNELVEPGFRVIGTGLSPNQPAKHLIKFIAAYQPTHLVLRAPIPEILRWTIKNKVPTITLLADSFQNHKLKHKLRNYRLARLLNNPQIEWVGNHGVSACRNLVSIGVKAHKVVPWDWPYRVTPSQFSAKHLPDTKAFWELVYVGSLSESKGVGDLIKAVSLLKQAGIAVKLKIAGKGSLETFRQKAIDLQVQAEVSFLGLVPHDTVVDLMRAADFVMVPSHHDYPEGFPLTLYEGLCSRTPIIASDHPMFCHNLTHQKSAFLCAAANPQAIANSVQSLITNPELYHQLSFNSEKTWQKLQVPVKWADFILQWLLPDGGQDSASLQKYCLSSNSYTS
ncbi:MAG: glycosyltransferase [Almyronema sp.]